MRYIIRVSALWALVCIILCCAAAQANTLTVSAPASIKIGETFFVSVSGLDLSQYGYTWELTDSKGNLVSYGIYDILGDTVMFQFEGDDTASLSADVSPLVFRFRKDESPEKVFSANILLLDAEMIRPSFRLTGCKRLDGILHTDFVIDGVSGVEMARLYCRIRHPETGVTLEEDVVDLEPDENGYFSLDFEDPDQLTLSASVCVLRDGLWSPASADLVVSTETMGDRFPDSFNHEPASILRPMLLQI